MLTGPGAARVVVTGPRIVATSCRCQGQRITLLVRTQQTKNRSLRASKRRPQSRPSSTCEFKKHRFEGRAPRRRQWSVRGPHSALPALSPTPRNVLTVLLILWRKGQEPELGIFTYLRARKRSYTRPPHPTFSVMCARIVAFEER